MLRKISLLAFLAGASVGAHAHALLLRGGADEEVATYNFEAEDVEKRVCDKYILEVCCAGNCKEGASEFKTRQEAQDAEICQNQCPGETCNWSWKAEGCRDPDKTKSSIQCTKPRPGKVKREGIEAVCENLGDKDVPYECEGDGSMICCTESDMTTVTFKNKDWGECTKIDDVLVISNA